MIVCNSNSVEIVRELIRAGAVVDTAVMKECSAKSALAMEMLNIFNKSTTNDEIYNLDEDEDRSTFYLFIKSTKEPCLSFSIEKDDANSNSLILRVHTIHRCGKTTGNNIIANLIAFAESNNFNKIIIDQDASSIEFYMMQQPVRIKLYALSVLIYGETWYNKKGFYSSMYTSEDNRDNKENNKKIVQRSITEWLIQMPPMEDAFCREAFNKIIGEMPLITLDEPLTPSKQPSSPSNLSASTMSSITPTTSYPTPPRTPPRTPVQKTARTLDNTTIREVFIFIYHQTKMFNTYSLEIKIVKFRDLQMYEKLIKYVCIRPPFKFGLYNLVKTF